MLADMLTKNGIEKICIIPENKNCHQQQLQEIARLGIYQNW